MTTTNVPRGIGKMKRCSSCGTVTTLSDCPRRGCRGALRVLTPAQAEAYVEKGHAAFDDEPRPNPALILVHGNPRPPAEVERAWTKFHGRDEFTGTVRDVGKIPGAPDYTFALGRCVDVDLGRGPQRFTPMPWLVCNPADDSLWIVADGKPMQLGSGIAGTEIRAVTYSPQASSGKDPARYRHRFESPRPEFSPVGNPNYCRAVMFSGGGYRVAGEEWIFA